VAAPATTAAPSPTSAAPAAGVRTDDLEAGLQQADSQLAHTGSDVGTADQPSQSSNY